MHSKVNNVFRTKTKCENFVYLTPKQKTLQHGSENIADLDFADN